MRRTLLALFVVATVAGGASPAHAQSSLAPDDRVRLAETFRLAAALGDELWPGWTGAPFAVLLVTPEREFLLRHPRPSADFTRVGHDSLLDTDVFARARVLAPNFLATFPAVGGVPTIVVGRPAATGKASTAWVLTLLHEHFHQLQMSRPGYYDGVAGLGLSRGDQTGMWMLDFPFPYDSSAVSARFGELTRALDGALEPKSRAARDARWRAVTDARAKLKGAIAADDEKYLAFQMWQEGVARYTELHVARWAAERFTPSAAFRALPDYTSFASAAAAIEGGIRSELRAGDLARTRRVLFYPVGAATALLLDEVAPGWRARYFEHAYSLDAMLP
jgi:hypothetical protein